MQRHQGFLGVVSQALADDEDGLAVAVTGMRIVDVGGERNIP